MAKFSDNKKKVVNLFFNRRKERRSRYNMALKNVNIPLNIKDFPSSITISNCAYIGENNEIANANNILIIGNNINWKGHGGPQSNTLVVGENLTSQSGAFDDYKNQVVIGEFNEPSTTQGSYLVVGDGTGKNELAHNILVVKKGQVNINGSLNINSSTDSSVTINAPINSDILLSNNNGVKFGDNNGPYIHVDNSSRLSISASNHPIYILEQSNYGDSSIGLDEANIDIIGANININGSTSITGNTSISGNLTTSNDVTISGELKLKSKYLVYNNGYSNINYNFPLTGGTLGKLLYKYNVKLHFSNSSGEYYLNLTLITSTGSLFNKYLGSLYYVDLTDSDNREHDCTGVLHSIMSYLTDSSSSDNTAYMDSYGSYIYDGDLLGIYGFKISKVSDSMGIKSYTMSIIKGADEKENEDIMNMQPEVGNVNYHDGFNPTGTSPLKYFAIIKEELN